MRVELLNEANGDLVAGFDFYDEQEAGLGDYFLASLEADMHTLTQNAGVHRLVLGSHRLLAKRFPFAIYYRLEERVARVRAVIDLRRDPRWIKRKLLRRNAKLS